MYLELYMGPFESVVGVYKWDKHSKKKVLIKKILVKNRIIAAIGTFVFLIC